MQTVRQLIDILTEEDPTAFVIMSKDEEGNTFRPLADVSTGMWDNDNEEMLDKDDVEEEDKSLLDHVVVLWPE